MVTKDDTPAKAPAKAQQKDAENKSKAASDGTTPSPQTAVPDRAPDAQRPAAKVDTSSAAHPTTKPDHDLTPPDPDQVVKATAKAEAAKEKLAQKNAVSVSKDDDNNVLGVATEHFNIARANHFGIEVVNVSKRGFVGPAQLTMTPEEVDELQDALDKF